MGQQKPLEAARSPEPWRLVRSRWECVWGSLRSQELGTQAGLCKHHPPQAPAQRGKPCPRGPGTATSTWTRPTGTHPTPLLWAPTQTPFHGHPHKRPFHGHPPNPPSMGTCPKSFHGHPHKRHFHGHPPKPLPRAPT
ncbi:histone deacetylase 4 [Platysternon megacephalum]|uniref:Histone deacetylase 4 n=1 Tax=Platysternon megacephalum TaxID=55544 RepID=A0A4D9DW64_9SAUR|nr:histone deacetylase 4 [Platysternon megacephalum]